MTTETALANPDKSPSEAAGYIAGTLVSIVRVVMPIRMWLTLFASTTLVIIIFNTDSLMTIARAVCCYSVIIVLLISSAIYRGKRSGEKP